MLSERDIERVTASLIRAEQDKLIRSGRMPREAHIDERTGPIQNLSRLGLTIDEEGLGFDSLARLGLVEEVNRFYGLSETGIEDYLLVHRKLSDWVELISQHFKRVGTSATFAFGSSGSTGEKGYHRHSWQGLLGEVEAHVAGPIAEGPKPSRVLVSVPTHHIYGFIWGVLIPAVLERTAIELPAGLPSPVLREATSGDFIVSTPFGLEQMAKNVGSRQLPDQVTAVSSGGPTTSRTWAACKEIGASRTIEIYGASETGGLGWRDDPETPFCCLSDIQKRGDVLQRAGKLLLVQDVLEWKQDRLFDVKGRKDKVVQVAGTNVNLDRVRQAILQDDEVKDAAIRLDGERLKAFVVPKRIESPTNQLEVAIRARLTELPAVARPDRFTFGPALPRSATGKLQDWEVTPQ